MRLIGCNKLCSIDNWRLVLDQIKELVTSPTYDGVQALRAHREQLLAKRTQLDVLITNLERTIETTEGKISMTNAEKFEGFKKKMIDENERMYGKEIRTKYGDDMVEKSNQKVMNMSQEDHDAITKLNEDLSATLAAAFKTGDPACELAQRAAELHKQWLTFYWSEYSKEAHVGLAQMYVDDERFTAYYDKIQPGTAIFLRDAIVIYTQS